MLGSGADSRIKSEKRRLDKRHTPEVQTSAGREMSGQLLGEGKKREGSASRGGIASFIGPFHLLPLKGGSWVPSHSCHSRTSAGFSVDTVVDQVWMSDLSLGGQTAARPCTWAFFLTVSRLLIARPWLKIPQAIPTRQAASHLPGLELRVRGSTQPPASDDGESALARSWPTPERGSADEVLNYKEEERIDCRVYLYKRYL